MTDLFEEYSPFICQVIASEGKSQVPKPPVVAPEGLEERLKEVVGKTVELVLTDDATVVCRIKNVGENTVYVLTGTGLSVARWISLDRIQEVALVED